MLFHIVVTTLQIKGETLETFVAQAQSTTKNAVEKSLEAAYQAWEQQLLSDQAVFQNEVILCLNIYLFCIFWFLFGFCVW